MKHTSLLILLSVVVSLVIIATATTSTLFITATTTGLSCSSPFGKECGSVSTEQHILAPMKQQQPHKSVVAFSNCDGEYVSNISGYVNYNDIFSFFTSSGSGACSRASCPTQIYTGLDMQCVQYARKWLLNRFGASFASIDYAYQIYALPTITRYKFKNLTSTDRFRLRHKTRQQREEGNHELDELKNVDLNADCYCTKEQVPFLSLDNNSTQGLPMRGDLLIYSTVGPGMQPTGHVCVVVRVTDTEVFIAEQNWSNYPWSDAGYSRVLSLKKSVAADGKTVYSIQDPPYQVLGIKRVEKA